MSGCRGSYKTWRYGKHGFGALDYPLIIIEKVQLPHAGLQDEEPSPAPGGTAQLQVAEGEVSSVSLGLSDLTRTENSDEDPTPGACCHGHSLRLAMCMLHWAVPMSTHGAAWRRCIITCAFENVLQAPPFIGSHDTTPSAAAAEAAASGAM